MLGVRAQARRTRTMGDVARRLGLMRLLLDTCVSGKSAAALRELGHDVEWVGDWVADPGDAAMGRRWLLAVS